LTEEYGVPDDLTKVNSGVLLAARNMFQVLIEMINAQQFPTSDSEEAAAELTKELDRIDVELIGRGEGFE